MDYYILIDGSYYIFYRLFALVNWWKLSHKDEPIDNLDQNQEFLSKFRKVCREKLKEIPKKLKLDKKSKIQYIIGKDCKRETIWRNEIHNEYKGTRGDYADAKVKPGPFFKLTYQENIFETTPDISLKTIDIDHLEADDCLAITTKYLRETQPDSQIIIITSDTDYLQLIQPNVSLFNLKFKAVNTPKNSFGCPKKDLLCKIITGDKSDNIPGLFKKCGPKTAEKYINNIELFQKTLEKENAFEQYKFNRKLIDFTQIPSHLQENCILKLSQLLE